MSACIKESPEGIQIRQALLRQADMTGSKMMPFISQFCPAHNQHHVVKMEGKSVDLNYGHGRPAVDVHLSQQEEYAEKTYQRKEYCGTCHSYHTFGQCRGARTRETVGS